MIFTDRQRRYRGFGQDDFVSLQPDSVPADPTALPDFSPGATPVYDATSPLPPYYVASPDTVPSVEPWSMPAAQPDYVSLPADTAAGTPTWDTPSTILPAAESTPVDWGGIVSAGAQLATAAAAILTATRSAPAVPGPYRQPMVRLPDGRVVVQGGPEHMAAISAASAAVEAARAQAAQVLAQQSKGIGSGQFSLPTGTGGAVLLGGGALLLFLIMGRR